MQNNSKKGAKRFLKPIIIVVSSVIALALLVIVGINIYFHAKYGEFYKVAETQFTIPGLSDNFIPQGLARTAEGTFLTCGYMKDGSASRIYRIGKNEGYVNLETDLGEADTNHAGGIAVYGNWVYLTSGESVAVYSLDAVMAASSVSSVKPVGKFPFFFEAAFVHAENDLLYVGEFYREENYPTAESHHILTPSGEMNMAIIAVFELNRDTEFGLADTVPARIYSIPGLAQGMCLTSDGKVCLSASYGMTDSHIYIYANPISTESRDKFFVENSEIPLYFLDNGNIEKTITLFPMSEEIAYVNEQIYVMCESASNKYIFGKLTGNNKLFSFSEK